MDNKINWIEADEYEALLELIKFGRLTPLVDLIETRLKKHKGVHSASLDAIRSLDRWDGGLDFYIKELPVSSKLKRIAGRPKNADADHFYQFKLNFLSLTIGKICFEAVESGEPLLPSKAELTRRILEDKEVSAITGFDKFGRTRRNEIIDEAYSALYDEKYPAGKPLN